MSKDQPSGRRHVGTRPAAAAKAGCRAGEAGEPVRCASPPCLMHELDPEWPDGELEPAPPATGDQPARR